MFTHHVMQCRKARFWRKVPFLAIIAVGLFASVANAKSDKSKLMDSMRVRFDQAIVDGDVVIAKKIWADIDSAFNDKYDKLAAKSLVYGGGSITWQNQLNKLHQQQQAKFNKMALFLSSINMNFISAGSDNSNGVLSGTVSDFKGKKIANAKVVFAGITTRTNDKGEFSLNGLPDGTFDLLAFAPGYQLAGDPARTVSTNRKIQLSLRLHATNYKPPQISQTEAKAKIDEAMAQLGKALTPAEPTGSETIEGTVVDAQSGQPIAGAKFIIGPAKADVSLSQVAVTDSNGRFTLIGVHSGVSEIAIIPPNSLEHLPFGQTVNMTGGGKTHRVTWKLDHVKQQ